MERSKTMTIIKCKDALRFIFPEVKELYYMADKNTGEEWVQVTAASTINYKEPGNGALYNFNINVTCDSTVAMVDDVWKELKRRFA